MRLPPAVHRIPLAAQHSNQHHHSTGSGGRAAAEASHLTRPARASALENFWGDRGLKVNLQPQERRVQDTQHTRAIPLNTPKHAVRVCVGASHLIAWRHGCAPLPAEQQRVGEGGWA